MASNDEDSVWKRLSDETSKEESVWTSLSASTNIMTPIGAQRGMSMSNYRDLENRVKELEREAGSREMLHEMRYEQWRKRIQDLEEQLQYLQTENRRLYEENAKYASQSDLVSESSSDEDVEDDPKPTSEDISKASEDTSELPVVKSLSRDDVKRYSRQLLLKDGFGVAGQCKLLSSNVLVVGAGGIGATALLYLAASGIGKISVVDFDEIELSNLHRQVIHKEKRVGMKKARSACRVLEELNSSIQYVPIVEELTHENALELVSRHDCVVDATDNPRTRYLINDACVIAGKPLVSGSAIGTEGQLTVYNLDGGGCYRCLYPKPNPTEGCKSCSDNGVLGSVPGLIGILQAVEVLKILSGMGTSMNNRLLMYDSLRCSFLSIKKPLKQPRCPVCGPDAAIKTMEDSNEATQMTRGPSGVVSGSCTRTSRDVAPPLPEELQISCSEYDRIRKSGEPHILLDVRVKRQFEMCSLEGATVMNIPLEQLSGEIGRISLRQIAEESNAVRPVFCLCRRGIFSTEATRILAEAAKTNPFIHSVYNIQGGLEAWSNEVDPSFPKY